MAKQVFIFSILLCFFCGTNSENGHLPPFIKPCRYGNSFNECIEDTIKAVVPKFVDGIEELGVKRLDPLRLKENIDVKGNGLDLVLKDVDLLGLRNSKIVSFKIDLEKETLNIKFIIDPVTMNGNYVINGSILHIPITGEGKATIEARNVNVDLKGAIVHPKTPKGEFLKLKSTDYTYDIEKTVFTFSNLYNGNSKLSEVTHKVVNENWKSIMDELAPGPIKQLMTSGIEAINKFFSTLDIHQIIEDYNF